MMADKTRVSPVAAGAAGAVASLTTLQPALASGLALALRLALVHRLAPALSLALALNAAAGANGAWAQDYPPGPAQCQNLSQVVTPPLAPAGWPTVEEQLARDHIRAGSALAALVRANQDFSLLRPAEAGDGKPLPPWMRVQWLRANPRARHLPRDRNGGYPAALLQVYHWMLRHQDLKPGPEPRAAGPEPRAATEAASGSGEQRISGAQPAAVSNSSVRIDADDPSRVLAVADESPDIGSRVMFYHSADGGSSWGIDTLPLGQFDIYQTGGAVEWTSDGTAWATVTSLKPVNTIWAYLQLRAYHSTDGGQSWTLDTLLSGSEIAAEQGSLAVDHGASSPYRDNVYALWSTEDSIFFARRGSADGVWHAAIEISDAQTEAAQEGNDIQVNSAGDIFAFWADDLSKIFAVKSTDGGASFGTPVVVARTRAEGGFFVPSTLAQIKVSGGTYRTATANNVYLVWPDLSGDPGCTVWTQEPSFTRPYGACRTRIWFARSTDGGATWSAPVRTADRPAVDDQFMPTLAVDATSGRLSLTYYDTIDDPSRLSTNLYYQSSSDGGTTWSDPLRVTTASTNETIQGANPFQYYLYNGLSAVGGQIIATWTDRRNGGFEEIWSAAISDPPVCSGPAATGLAATAQPAGVELTWDAVPGATYRVLRAAASGGPYSLVAVTTINGYFDAATACAATSYYAVQVESSGCLSPTSAEAPAVSRPLSVLYSNDFDSSSGLADWTSGALPGLGSAADWRGIQSCPAHSGSNIFRFGGGTCTSGAAAGDAVFAYPHGPDGIPVPAGASNVQLSFWQRREFDTGSGGMLALAASDLSNSCVPIGPRSISGDGYNALIHSTCLTQELFGQPFFTGTSSSFTNTVVDLDLTWAVNFGSAGSSAGHVIEPIFFGITDCGVPPQTGWFLDDVTVTACTAAPAPAYGFYTVTPCRLLDTRLPAGPGGGPALGPAASRDLILAGQCGIPPTARAVSVNVTVVQPAMTGSLLLYADDQPVPPLANTISFNTGAVRANNTILALGNGTGGAIAQNQSAGNVQLLIDVNGYYQ
jgi:hypothetical protein